MKLGLFVIPIHPASRDYAETLREDREAFILADKLGFAEGFCGEHLTDRIETITSSLVFIASLADATSRITLGSAVVNLPHSHPVLLASHAAMVDNILRGRFIFGVGAGIIRSDAEALGILSEDRGAMYNEAIDHIVALWTGKPPYDLKGRYWNISTAKTQWPEAGLGGVVPTYQTPHPPILGTASDPFSKTMTAIGRRGWLPASSGMLHMNWLKNHWANFAQGAAEGGHPADRARWRVGRLIFVADDEKRALAYGRNASDSPYRFHLEHLAKKFRKAGLPLRSFKPDDTVPDDALTLDHIVDNLVIAGGVSSVVDQILAMCERIGEFGTLLYISENWSDPQLSRRSMELMAEKVMPAVNAALRSAASQPQLEPSDG